MPKSPFAILLATAVAASSVMVPLGSAQSFTDVKSTTRYSTAINALKADGVVDGYADLSFKPNDTINRAELLKIVLETRENGLVLDDARDCFPDVSANDWFSVYVCAAQDEGIVEGYPSGFFEPDQDVTFVEAAKIMTLAYDQEPIETGGIDWYEGYALTLEASRAIPPTIAKLDAKLTRGEMAEMMWRLREGRTDQESKAYANVKNPDLGVDMSLETPQYASSCGDLMSLIGTQRAYPMLQRTMMDDAVAAPMGIAQESRGEAMKAGSDGDYSSTNVQVEGVDEGAIVKTDGGHIYAITGQHVRIVKASQNGSMTLDSSIDLSTGNFTPSDLYVDGDTLIVIGTTWEQSPMPYYTDPLAAEKLIAPWQPPYWSRTRTAVRLYDIADRTDPKLTRSIQLDGSSISTRRIDDKLYLVLQDSPYWYGPMPLRNDVKLPTVRDSLKGDEDVAAVPCRDVLVLPHLMAPQYLIVATVDTDDRNADVERTVMLGNAQNVYASTENLYVSATHWNYTWDPARPSSTETTQILRFDFTDDGVEFAAEGSVPGHILNQFSMDERDATFRVATTQSPSGWDGDRMQSSNLFVLNADMKTVGSITDIAPGEQIYSVRFMGDRAYMVTFRAIDPFFVIDLSDARNPEILGQLKIPGYSNYLHPYDENHVLGFGKDAVTSKDGSFAWYQGMKVALFDVTDVEHPKELHKLAIGDRGTDSPLLYNHKALLLERERDLLAFPLNVAEIPAYEKTEEDSMAYGSTVFQGAHVYTIDIKNGFDLRGEITHYTDADIKKMGDYWWSSDKDIQRILRIGSHLYTLSNGELQSHTEDDVDRVSTVKF